MADLETLTLRITEESSKAFSAIDKLAKRLDGLSVAVAKLEVGKLNDLASGLTNLNNAIATINASTSKTDYNKIVANLITLSSVDTSRLDGLSGSLINLGNAFQGMSGATSVTASIREMITAIAKLGGVSIQRAITNIPQLETALGNLIRSFSTLPNVNQSVIDFTNALANLASQGQKTGSAAHTISASMESLSISASRATKRTHSLASTIGTLYAKFWLLLRGARGLKNAFMDAADYLEAYNYFDVTAKKIGKDTFTKAGIGSAEQYAEAFTQTLQEKLHKMSGLELDLEQRLIKTTNAKSLGLNLTELTQYQASIASITNAMGVSQEIAQSTAKAFSMLAGDMGSLKNLDFEQVSQNLQSALTGQARALYKYGIDLTTATLQQYAYAEGIDKSVSEMTQAEKAQLRLLAILDQSKVSWGDLANTINSPSNQLRMLKNNLKEVGTVMGQLFIPIMQSVLPVLNGLSMAIKQLMVDIAELLGIKLDLESFGTFGDEVEADVDSVEDLNKAMKETKKSIREFDELKVINNSKDRGSGLGEEIDLTKQIIEATAEYEKVWDEAYRRMTSKAQEIAGYISAAFEPIKKIIQDFHVGDFFKAGEDVSDLVISIFDFFSDAISEVDWEGLGKKIGEFLDGVKWDEILKSVGGAIGSALQGIINLWKGMFDVAPFETALISSFALMKFTGLDTVINKNLTLSLRKWVRKTKFDKFITKAGLGSIAIGLSLALSIDNINKVSTGKRAATSLESLASSAISSLLAAAGFTMVASSLGLGHLGLVFAVTAGLSLLFNVIAAKIAEPDQKIESEVDRERREWAEQFHLDNIELFTEITIKEKDVDIQIGNIDKYASKVQELSARYEELTDAERAELKFYSDELIKLVPDVADSINDITGAYEGTTDALNKLIEAQKTQIRLEASRDSLVSLEKRKMEIESDPGFADMNKAVADAERGYKHAWDKLKAMGKTDDEIQKYLMMSEREVKKLTGKEGTWALSLWMEWENFTKYTSGTDFNHVWTEWSEINRQIDYYTGEYTKAFTEMNKGTEEELKNASDTLNRSKLPRAVETTMDKVNKQITNGETVSKANMNRMFNGINNSFSGLGDGKVPAEIQKAMDNVKKAIEESSPELEAMMKLLRQKLENAFSEFQLAGNGELLWNPNDVVTNIDKAFNSIQTALETGAKPGTKTLKDNVSELFGGNIPKTVNDSLNALAKTIDSGGGKKAVLDAMDNLKKDIVTTAADLGMNVDLGVAGGVFNGVGEVEKSTSYMVENGLVNPYKRDTKTSSPSKLFEDLAEYVPEGAAIGVEKGTPKLVLAVNNMVDSMKNAFGGLKYNVPKIDFGGSVGSKRYDYGNMDMNNAFMSQMSNMASQMAQSGQTEVVFRVEGDPHGMFKVIREQNDIYRRQTNGRSAF